MDRLTWLPPTLLALTVVLPCGCGDDGGGGGQDEVGDTGGDGSTSGGEDTSADGSTSADASTDTGGSTSADGSTDTGGSTSADASTDTGGSTSADGSTDTGGVAGLSLALLPNSAVVLEANNGGLLTADCMLFEDGLPAAIQPEFSVELSPAEGATAEDPGWSFPQFGTWQLSCSATVDGQDMSIEREIAVLNDALDPRLAEAGAGLGASAAILAAVLAANEGDDQLLVDAVEDLEGLAPDFAAISAPGFDDVLRPVPGDYPSAAALTDLGIAAVPDDDALAGALADVEAALDNFAATYAGLDPDLEPTQSDLDQLTSAGAELEAALEAASALEPSAHGWLANRTSLALLVRDHLAPTVDAANAYVVARAQAEAPALFSAALPGAAVQAPQPEGQPDFGLLSLSMGMFGQSYLRINLINKFYGDAIAALDKSINNLILAEGIDYFFPVNENGPIVDFFQASASLGYALPGYDTWVYGSHFNSDPDYNLFLIFGDQWQGVVDNILGACGVSSDNSVFENIDALDACVADAQGAIDSIINYSIEVVEPGILDGQDVHLGPFPEACSGFLPVATVVVPINLATGRGESILVNCLP